MSKLTRLYVDAAKKVARKQLNEWQKLHLEEVKAIDEIKKAHSFLPDNYWMSRHRAEQRYRSALLVLQVLEEIDAEVNADSPENNA